jgi:hypothetical protein
MWYYPCRVLFGQALCNRRLAHCVAIATAFFGCPALTGALDSSTGDRHFAAATRVSALTAQPMALSSRFRRSGRMSWKAAQEKSSRLGTRNVGT